MANSEKYRHELKYIVSNSQIADLYNRASALMAKDPHTDEKGAYLIKSLYFDSHGNRCFYENQNGTDPREKFRIRIYNNSSERISLECKRKERGKTFKSQCSLTKQQAELMINGGSPDIGTNSPQLLNRLGILIDSELFHPVTVVEYTRIPLIYELGNVRVTFDTNICSVPLANEFFAKSLEKRPIMPVGMHLMEVKYDEFLPDFIYRSLNLGHLRQTTFSKFYLSRKFSLYR